MATKRYLGNSGEPDYPPYDAISGADAKYVDPIIYLTSYVNSSSFENKAPNKEYIRQARSNVKRVSIKYKPDRFTISDFFNGDVIKFSGAPYAYDGVIYMPEYNTKIEGNYPDDKGYNDITKGKRVYNREDVLAHELGHLIDPMIAKPVYSGSKVLEYKDAPYSYLELLHNHNRNDLNYHDLSDNEKYADLQQLRYLLYKSGIYDSRSNTKFNNEHLKKAKELGLRTNSRLMQMFDDDTIIDMLNTIAYNDTQKSRVTAKYGYGLRRTLASGGSIYIKPSHRGRFTALKERTGHSATWFKENGTPAQKKMATFALNAAKWKH